MVVVIHNVFREEAHKKSYYSYTGMWLVQLSSLYNAVIKAQDKDKINVANYMHTVTADL